MRVRLVLVLLLVLVAFVAAGAVFALWGGGPARDGVVTESLADLAVGHTKAITVELPDDDHSRARLFLTRSGAHDVHTYLAVSTHLGCRIVVPAVTSHRSFFEDPCGGSRYSFAGKCTGGPCPRGLDSYAVEVRDDHAEIDLRRLITGPTRGA